MQVANFCWDYLGRTAAAFLRFLTMLTSAAVQGAGRSRGIDSFMLRENPVHRQGRQVTAGQEIPQDCDKTAYADKISFKNHCL